MVFRFLKVLPLFLICVATACGNADPCDGVDCGAQGSCSAGACTCNDGYVKGAGGKCDTEARARFLGSWTASDDCPSSGTRSYLVTVTASAAGLNSVELTNWASFTQPVTATIAGDAIAVARQEPDNDNYYVEGTGTFTTTASTWSYIISDETDRNAVVSDRCTGSWTK
jgi:hypothetical protein